MGPHRQLVLAFLVLAGLAGGTGAETASISDSDRAFLAEADLLLTEDERDVFTGLDRAYQRSEFIERFWASRDPFPESGRNELLEVWERRRDLVLTRFGSFAGVRPGAMTLVGPPNEILTGICTHELRPLEIWRYAPSAGPSSLGLPGSPLAEEGIRDGFALVFVESREPAAGFEPWAPDRGIELLLREPDDPATGSGAESRAQRCLRATGAEDVLSLGVGWETLFEGGRLLPRAESGWLAKLTSSLLTEGPAAPTEELPVTLEIQFPARRNARTVLQAALTVPGSDLTGSAAAADGHAGVLVRGRIVRADRLVDTFRYLFDVGSAENGSDDLSMVFERLLASGDYQLHLGVEDLGSGRRHHSTTVLRVPRTTGSQPPGSAWPGLLEANEPLSLGDHVVRIVPPPPVLHTGRLRVEARVLGEGVERVSFLLDGRPQMSKTRPPYSLEIDLGSAPRIHELVVLALDAEGVELARDRLPINTGPHRFTVRLVEPLPTRSFRRSLRARLELTTPRGESLERVELFVNETRQVTLFQPPWTQPLLLTGSEPANYVRAVAYLEDGNRSEDLVFVNLAGGMDRLRVNFVELYTTVHDRSSRPVEGLTRGDFTVTEAGVEQDVVRFERVRDRPIHAGILLDTSTSMTEELDEAVRAGLRFFESVLTPKDRAAIVVFNDAPELVVPFTSRVPVLTAGLEDLEAEGDTALYDSLAFTLHHFAGIRGKRAVILLSDGSDSGSHFTFDETLDFARRTGVAVYTIGLGVSPRNLASRAVLLTLAKETGGRYFTVSGAAELDAVYLQIEEELRSQYLLGYQSSADQSEGFREVSVEVAGKGLEVRTIRGYYP